jgi:acyl-CoA thioesterase I
MSTSRLHRASPLSRRQTIWVGVILPIVLLTAGFTVWLWPKDSAVPRLSNLAAPGELLVFFGDSITAGWGLTPAQSFPALVGDTLGVPILNAGIAGNTTADGLARLSRDVLSHHPRLVLVEFVGNDFLRGVPIAHSLHNLDAIVSGLIREGAMVVILEVGIGMGRDPYRAGFRTVAEKHGALLVPDFLSGILANQALTLDMLHPNAEGQRILADRATAILRPLLERANRMRGAQTGSFRLLPVRILG